MSPSIWQILIVVLLVMLLFGTGKLPRLMGDLAEGIKSFKRGMRDDKESPSKNKSADSGDDSNKTLN